MCVMYPINTAVPINFVPSRMELNGCLFVLSRLLVVEVNAGDDGDVRFGALYLEAMTGATRTIASAFPAIVTMATKRQKGIALTAEIERIFAQVLMLPNELP